MEYRFPICSLLFLNPLLFANSCADASLRMYVSDPPNEAEPDYVYCGPNENPPMSLASDGAIMVLVFRTGNNPPLTGQGFKLQYTFETDYRLGADGALQPGGCNFLYKSTNEKKSGNFQSSRYPSSYPAQITCSYEFRPAEDEQVMLVFQSFRLLKENRFFGAQNLLFKSYELNATLDPLNGYGDDACSQDFIEIYELPFKGEQQDYPGGSNFNSQSSQRKARSASGDEELARNQKLFSLNFDNLIDDQVLDGDKQRSIHSQVFIAFLTAFQKQTH